RNYLHSDVTEERRDAKSLQRIIWAADSENTQRNICLHATHHAWLNRPCHFAEWRSKETKMPLPEGCDKHPGNPRGTPQTLIRDPQLRLQIHAQKQSKILEWLKTEIYSSPEILALVRGRNHRQSLHKILVTMQEQSIIRHARVPVVGGHQILWGITEHGQALAYDVSKNETPSPRVFEPGRISALRLRHILGLQKMKW